MRKFNTYAIAIRLARVVLAFVVGFALAAKEPLGLHPETLASGSVRVRRTETPRPGALSAQRPTHLNPATKVAGSGERGDKGLAPLASDPATYTLGQLAAMNYADMVTALGEVQWSAIPGLWDYTPDTKRFFGDPARVQALIDAITARGAAFTDTDSKGIRTLAEVLRVGFYFGWYYTADIPAMHDQATFNKGLLAVRACQKNPNFKLSSPAGFEVIMAMGLIVADSTCNLEVVLGFQGVLEDFNANFETYSNTYGPANAWYYTTSGIDWAISSDLPWGASVNAVSAPGWFGKIDGYLGQMFATASQPKALYTQDRSWAIDNAIYYSARSGRAHSAPNRALQALSDAIKIYGATAWNYASASAAYSICNTFNGVDYHGSALNWASIQAAIRQQYLPVSRSFDGGLFVAHYGNAVTAEKVKTLVWAHKETKAHFFRAMGWDTPVDPQQTADNTLRIMVYNSPYEYRMNTFAYDLDTSNGGMYIEQDGTFYTYERTTAESYYSLEELFRHEGVHYLQGRYEEPGLFGQTLYTNDRLTWMDEGSAEFFAGATRTDGIKTRQIKVRLIAQNDPSTWFTIPQVVTSSYSGGFLFYNYACELVDHLYRNNWNTYLSLLERLRSNDGAGFDAVVAALAGSAAENSGYQAWLQTVVGNVADLTTPSTSSDYLAPIAPKPVSQVVSEVQVITGIPRLVFSGTVGQDWNTFTLRGAYVAGTTKGGKLADWKAMDAQANRWLTTLTNSGWAGYKTVTCYFVNYAVNNANQATWEVVFHGVNTDDGSTMTPLAATIVNPTVNTTVTAGTALAFLGAATSGYTALGATTYSWDFGDGVTSNLATPGHAYSSPATYQVTLTVTDAAGKTATANRQLTVNPMPTTVAITTPPTNVFTGGVVAIKASVTGTGGVVWSATAGTIASNGANAVFTAPASVGTVTITATSTTDATKTATVTLVVIERDVLGLIYLAKAYGTRLGDPGYLALADVNGDGIVNDDDIKAFIASL